MTSPTDHTSAQRRIQADPWVDRDVGALPRGDRLHPEQPESGLLWVLAGRVSVQRDQRVREIRPGTVVSYRLGPSLSWEALEGARVRWSGRPVKLDSGEVASWTANLAMDVDPEPEPAPRRRGGIYATAAIALTWIVALTVAWCYHQAQADRETAPVGLTSPTEPVSGGLSAAERAELAHAVADLFAAAGHARPVAFVPGGKTNNVDVRIPVAAQEQVPTSAFQEAAGATLSRWPDLRVVRVVLFEGPSPWSEVAYRRDSLTVTDYRDGR